MGKLGGGFTKNLPKEQRAINDFYPTPNVAFHILRRHVFFKGNIWEPASGSGPISKYLENLGYNVYSSDIRKDVYGTGGVDFLKCEELFDNIITNPPFCLAEEFVRKSFLLARRKSVFLLRLAFLESERRFRLFTEFPPAMVIVISRRLPFFDHNKSEWIKTGSTFPHAWFVWDKEHEGDTIMKWGTF